MNFDPLAVAAGGVGFAPPLFVFEGWFPEAVLPPTPTGGAYFDGLKAKRRRKDDEEALLLTVLQ